MIKQIKKPSFFEFGYFGVILKFIILRKKTYDYPLSLKSFNTIIYIVFFFLGFFESVRWLWPIALTWFFFSAYYYFSLENIAKNIEVRRFFPEKARDGEKVTLIYELANYSHFSLLNFKLEEYFEGSSQQSISISSSHTIPSESRHKLRHKVKLDNGMGEKKFNNLSLIIWDPLGLFKYRVEFKSKDSMVVYPSIKNYQHSWDKAFDMTSLFGNYEVNTKGDSTNFIGIKHYRKGEPLRYINWPLSLKHDDILINEFDQLVNAETTILINDHFKYHIGRGKKSTFEYMRNLALTIALDQLEKGNELRLMTSTQSHQFNRGKEYFRFLEKYICSLELNKSENISPLLEKVEFQKGESLVYLVPLHPYPELLTEIERLKKITYNGTKVTLVLVDSLTNTFKGLDSDLSTVISGLLKITMDKKKAIEELLKGTSLFYHILTADNLDFDQHLKALMRKHDLHQDSYRG